MSVNKVILIGRVGQDPELKTTNNGKSVCNFSLATSERRGGEEKTEWHRVTCWEKTADLVAQYVKKGREIYVEGKITYREYQKDGVTMKATDIIASNVTFIGSNRDQSSGQGQSSGGYSPPSGGGGYKPPSSANQGKTDDPGYFDEEVPF